jgi:hypothetical protein
MCLTHEFDRGLRRLRVAERCGVGGGTAGMYVGSLFWDCGVVLSIVAAFPKWWRAFPTHPKHKLLVLQLQRWDC